MNTNTNTNSRHTREPQSLSENAQGLLNHYIQMYNTTLRQVDLLYANLDEIRRMIDFITISSIPESPFSNNSFTMHPISFSTARRTHPYYTAPPPPMNPHIQEELIRRIQDFYASVVVAPSPAQIESAVLTTRFSAIENPQNVSCPIGLERFTADQTVSQIRQCGHIFDTAHLNAWFERNVRCPMCRYDIRSTDPSANTVLSTPQDNHTHFDYPDEPEEQTQEQEQEQIPIDPLPTYLQNTNTNASIFTNIQYDGEQIVFDISSNNITSALSNISTMLLTDLLRRGGGVSDSSGNFPVFSWDAFHG